MASNNLFWDRYSLRQIFAHAVFERNIQFTTDMRFENIKNIKSCISQNLHAFILGLIPFISNALFVITVYSLPIPYYILSISRGYIWCDSAHSTTIIMIRLQSYFHTRTTPHTSPLRASYGVSFASYTKKKMIAIYWERTVYFVSVSLSRTVTTNILCLVKDMNNTVSCAWLFCRVQFNKIQLRSSTFLLAYWLQPVA